MFGNFYHWTVSDKQAIELSVFYLFNKASCFTDEK